ncbi:hypothetical protein PybrP1_003098 [[Pythium] brassicae (nom. inval.)]|nr:hypothetical protein PybrP1_003098 [[Pythium] brassicae (nom. inval.)]
MRDDEDDEVDGLVEEPPQPHEIASDPALRCRYPSKHCERRRTIKKTGALHSMCAFHRAKANRNQRRLEKRKRFLKDEARTRRQAQPERSAPSHSLTGVSSESTMLLPLLTAPATATPPAAPASTPASYPSPCDVDLPFFAHLEPFSSPVPLFKEDLEELRALVDFSVTGVHVSYAATPAFEEPHQHQFRIV